VLLAIGAAIAILGGGLMLLQRRLIYFPHGSVPPIDATLPGWQEIAFDTSDGLSLAGWFTPPGTDAPTVIVFPGNAGNRADRALLGSRLADEGYGVLLFDYRGYGGNPGHPTESGLARDARAAAAFVEEQAGNHPMVYFGESLGAAVAVELATTHPPAALILRSPFTSLPDVARVHYPLIPAKAALWDEYPSLDRIGRVTAPLLVIAGAADSTVPVEQSRTLYEAAPGPRELLIIADADHNDLALLAGDELFEAVVRFTDRHLTE
jgi:fermentation-respiration switch protein FrsA (DUF1100 family)